MADEQGRKMTIKIEQHSFMGIVWCATWLFTIGYLHLDFWRGVLLLDGRDRIGAYIEKDFRPQGHERIRHSFIWARGLVRQGLQTNC